MLSAYSCEGSCRLGSNTGASGIPFQTRLRGTVARRRNPYLIFVSYFNLCLNIRVSLLPEAPF